MFDISPCFRPPFSPLAGEDGKLNALLIATSMIAAVRTAREERILPFSPMPHRERAPKRYGIPHCVRLP